MGKSQSKENIETCYDNEVEKAMLSFLLMGKTGHGKSSLGNSLLGCEFFKVSNDANSQTAEVKCGFSEFESFSLKVVDLPGLADTTSGKRTDTKNAVRNMNKTLTMCSEGVDAFIFVFRLGARFTSEELSALETLKVIFGKDYFKHAIVVLTGGDSFYKEENNFDDWCKRQTGTFRELYKACNGRFVLFNNKEKVEEKQIEQREQLIQLALELKRRHGSYTEDCFKLAAYERQKFIIEMKEPILKEEIQRQAGILTSKIQKYRKQPNAKQRKEIERAIRKLKKEVKAEDKGRGSLKDLMKTVEAVEKNLYDVKQFHKLAARLEKIRNADMIWSAVGIVCNEVGGMLSLVFPKAGGIITLGFSACNTLGTVIIKSLENSTETKLNDIISNMSTSVTSSDAT